MHDLHNLVQDLRGDQLYALFVPIWSRRDKKSSNKLFKVLVRTLIRSILVASLPRVALIGFSFAQPYLLERVVSLLESEHPRRDFENGLVIAAALIYAGIMASRAWYNYITVCMTIKTRGILISAIFDKTLRLEHHQAKKLAAVTLMSTDTDGVAQNVRTLYEFVANLLELVVGLAILATRVGPACVLLLLPTALLSVIATRVGKQIAPSQITWNKSIEDRVSKTSALLRQIRTIKMVGQGPAAIEYIQKLRKTEIEESKRYRFLQAVLVANGMLIYCLTPISVMAGSIFWTRSGETLKPSSVFTVLSIVAIVSTPLSKVVASYPRVAATFGRLRRIEAFLLLSERHDQRTFKEPPTLDPAEGTSSSGEAEKQHGSGSQDGQSWDVYPVNAHKVHIAATKASGNIVSCASFTIPRRKFTMLVGKTGCGKSTLLRSLLGEAIITEGSVSLERRTVAYCDQDVWIQNISIRENIIGACEYDARWYTHVLTACQLLRVIEAFPSGDETVVGSDGLKLSGGQKARVALARAVYALAPLILLDDIFAALDEATADSIFEALLGAQGVLRRTVCAVVLATSSGKYLPLADHLLFLDANRSVVMICNKVHIPEYAKFLEDEPAVDRIEAGEAQAQPAEPGAPPATQPPKALEVENPNVFRQHGDANLYLIYFQSIPKKLLAFWLTLLCVFALFSGDMSIIGQDLPNSMSLVIYGASSPINYKATGIDIFKDCFLVVIDVGIISAGAKYMAFAVPFLFLILFLLQKYYLRTSRQLRFMDLEAKSPLYTHFTETARGLLHIRGLRREANFTARLHTLLNNSQKPNYYLIAVQQWLTAAMDCIGMLLGISLVALASKFGDSSPSGTGLALLNLITFSEQLTFFMNDWTGLETSLGAIARLDSFVKHTPVEKDAADAATPPPTWPEDGTIEFRGVDVGYGGKTTMLLTLLNMLEHDGPLLIDGIDITHVPRQVLRTRITTISQDFFEVPGSLRDNLLPPESTRPTSADQRLDDEAVQNILFVAGLSDVVRDRGGGLNAPFDELGFSRGEMQLVALARAIIHTLECRTRIVLLDEATGVLDSDTRATIQTAMSRYFANHTVIIISHQKDAVKTVDKVYDMNTNRVFH
ncbi:hypothetical protein V2A60_002532 [Cordyceps javanica]